MKIWNTKFIIFCFLPAIIVFMIFELGLRMMRSGSRINGQYFLDSERVGLDIDDELLFWKMKPSVNMIWQGVNVKTNSLGLRDNEVSSEKKKNVFRILSLGESATFGAKVKFEKIYSELLE